MSLDVTLRGEKREVECVCVECENKHRVIKQDRFFSSNITHNLSEMAEEAGIYKHCWRPEELGITKAKELIEPLRDAVNLMEAEPERFIKHNAKNGWGTYKHFVPWVKEYLAACERFPEATIEVWR